MRYTQTHIDKHNIVNREDNSEIRIRCVFFLEKTSQDSTETERRNGTCFGV